MTSADAAVRWEAEQQALKDVVSRLTAMLRTLSSKSLPGASPPAVGQWNLAEVAVHLSQVWELLPSLSRAGAGGPIIGHLSELAGFTASRVTSCTERDLRVLADQIDDRAAAYFADTVGQSAEERCPWMVEDTFVSRSVLTCHLLSENVVHGYDIARAAGVPWRIERPHASMVLTGFLAAVIPVLDPGALVVHDKANGLRATFDIRLRGGDGFAFVFDAGELRAEELSGRRADCHLSADPVAMLLVAWGRQNQWPLIARGRLLAWGRKPWLALRLSSLVRNP